MMRTGLEKTQKINAISVINSILILISSCIHSKLELPLYKTYYFLSRAMLYRLEGIVSFSEPSAFCTGAIKSAESYDIIYENQ